MADILWFIAVAGGPILLGGAILFATMRSRRLSAGEKRERSEAVHDLYKSENRP
jgi:hypothetical protein